jgi:hypothetical protein
MTENLYRIWMRRLQDFLAAPPQNRRPGRAQTRTG